MLRVGSTYGDTPQEKRTIVIIRQMVDGKNMQEWGPDSLTAQIIYTELGAQKRKWAPCFYTWAKGRSTTYEEN